MKSPIPEFKVGDTAYRADVWGNMVEVTVTEVMEWITVGEPATHMYATTQTPAIRNPYVKAKDLFKTKDGA